MQLFFYNEISSELLLFDGLVFSYASSTIAPLSGFKELRGNDITSYPVYEIVEIRQSDFDTAFIKFSNGNIFQIHTMPFGYDELRQVLSIYEKTKHSFISTPSGISFYEATLLGMDRAEECEIEIE